MKLRLNIAILSVILFSTSTSLACQGEKGKRSAEKQSQEVSICNSYTDAEARKKCESEDSTRKVAGEGNHFFTDSFEKRRNQHSY